MDTPPDDGVAPAPTDPSLLAILGSPEILLVLFRHVDKHTRCCGLAQVCKALKAVLYNDRYAITFGDIMGSVSYHSSLQSPESVRPTTIGVYLQGLLTGIRTHTDYNFFIGLATCVPYMFITSRHNMGTPNELFVRVYKYDPISRYVITISGLAHTDTQPEPPDVAAFLTSCISSITIGLEGRSPLKMLLMRTSDMDPTPRWMNDTMPISCIPQWAVDTIPSIIKYMLSSSFDVTAQVDIERLMQ
jgi:hypothetical protein